MKTPREVLLARHQAADAKLVRIRRDAVRVAADVNRRSAPVRELTFAPTVFQAFALPFRELIWPCRGTWAGLAAIWLVILAFNLTQTQRIQTVAAKSTTSPAEIRLAFLEQQRLLAEIIGPTAPAAPAEPPRRSIPQPRSERRTTLMMA